MENRQRHEMVLEENHPSGAQNWYCPSCGQALLVTWTPRFMTVIRNAGNKSASHTLGNYRQSAAGKPLSLDHNGQEGDEMHPDQAGLAPWLAWMEAIDFEQLWDNKME